MIIHENNKKSEYSACCRHNIHSFHHLFQKDLLSCGYCRFYEELPKLSVFLYFISCGRAVAALFEPSVLFWREPVLLLEYPQEVAERVKF